MAVGYQGGDAAYGYGSYYGSGLYYSSPPPGGYLDAGAYLYGPGSHAYLSESTGFGTTYTSYAYEGSRGGILEQGTTSSSFGVSQETSYRYAGGGSSYIHIVDTFTPSKPIAAGGAFYGYYQGSSIPNHLENYRYSSFTSSFDPAGGYTHASEHSFSLTTYTDGSSVSHFTSVDQLEDGSGHILPGSRQIYHESGFDYGNGYTVYVQD